MNESVDQSAKREASAESEARNAVVGVKSEPLDCSALSGLPLQERDSETIGHATPALQLNAGEKSGDSESQSESNEASNLGKLCEHVTLDTLEPGVAVATRLLDQLRDVLSTHTNPDVDNWIKSIVDLSKRTTPNRTVVGVVGNTGAGKSSVINALLDEERLLPTNCLRACTASPIEISFNPSDDDDERYRAEIEFISTEDWTRELQVLFSDLLDGSGNVAREATKADSDAGIAYAKVKAVYPQKTREMLAEADPNKLAQEPAVRRILGTTKRLKAKAAKELYQQMQHYVDSKEKSASAPDNKKRVDVAMEYWPLIKVVRIFMKADALSTGAVIVDLPGVQDSNAARAAVAANYMKSCTGLWIVAPITRAVDDKTAKSLLGDTFKRQLKYDGTYSAVTFICSKTDDISITEAAESLGLEGETSESWDTAEKLRKSIESLKSRIVSLKKDKARLVERIEELEAESDTWEDLQAQSFSGETVYTPSANSKKRKRGSNSLDAFESDGEGVDFDSSDKENSQSGQNRKPLTEEDIEERISTLRAQRKRMRGERRSLESQIAELGKKVKNVRDERETVLADIKAICIQGRNEYSRSAIKQDFAMGIKELDQENAVEEDDANFDPDDDARDYDEVARSLPVFCVSSRAYQKLSGKLEKDDFQSHGFLSIEDTEIPKLQKHAKKLTEAGRIAHCRQFLNDVSQLVNSLKLWSANGDTGSNLTDDEKHQEEKHLMKLLGNLEEELFSSIKKITANMEQSLEEQIFETIDAFTPAAIAAAPDTAYSWGAPRREGGMYWATYKATVRRQGVYCGASGPRDFNQDLFDPISRNLASGWERAFQRRVPAAIHEFVQETAVKLHQFHQAAKIRAEQRHTNYAGLAGLATLSRQIQGHVRTVEALPTTINAIITESQRETSRQFTPVICHAMTTAYTICTEERGPGSYARMKDAMLGHVDFVRHSMFQDARNVVKMQLDAMCRTVESGIAQGINTILETIRMDYMRTLVGTVASLPSQRSFAATDLRFQVIKRLVRGDKAFSLVLDGDWGAEADKAIFGSERMHDSAEANAHYEEDIANQADELMQAAIRDQGLVEDDEDDGDSEDTIGSDVQFPGYPEYD